MTGFDSGVRPVPGRQASKKENYIVFSDVHLGADLVQHVRPWTTERLRRVAEIDRHLCEMLDWYLAQADPDVPWKLIIAGDLVDFIGMAIAPNSQSAVLEDDQVFGLGSRREHAAFKLEAVVQRHETVFSKLGEFVGAGHALVLIRGNHDVEFHWQDARDAFRAAVVNRLPAGTDAELASSRIEFFPWFYYVKGLLYVEHGHQFDAMCSQYNVLAPVSPLDPDAISITFSDLLLRMVVRPTPGIGSDGHETTGILDYIRFGVSLGFGGAFRLFTRYVSATARAFGRFRSHSGSLAVQVREVHQRRLRKWAARFELDEDHVHGLARLAPRPVTAARLAILRSMFMDQLLLGALIAAVCVLSTFLFPWTVALAIGCALIFAKILYVRKALPLRRADVDCDAALERAASKIMALMPSKFVVMGHTHRPRVSKLVGGGTYVNLGNWATDDLDGPGEDAPRTHFVVRWTGEEPHAALYRWDGSGAPVPATDFH